MTHLRMFNARGAMPESLSGSYYRLLDNGVPHQMFSELVGMPGLIDGILGLDPDVPRPCSSSDASSAARLAGTLQFANFLSDRAS